MIFSFGQIWPLKTQLCACLRIDYENMAFFLRKNHWVKIWGGGEHFHFWPRTWVVKMDVFGHGGQIWPDQNFFGPPIGRHQNSGRNEVWNTSETQKLTEIWLKPFFSENAKKIMDFGGLVCSGSSWELILGFLSGPNASWVSVLPTKPAGKVWATSKKNFLGGCTNTMKSLNQVSLHQNTIWTAHRIGESLESMLLGKNILKWRKNIFKILDKGWFLTGQFISFWLHMIVIKCVLWIPEQLVVNISSVFV